MCQHVSINPGHLQAFIEIKNYIYTVLLIALMRPKFYIIFVAVHVACHIPVQLMVTKCGRLIN